jgi:YggT family protein
VYLIGYFLQAVAGLLHMLLMLAVIVVIARAVLSWVSPDPYNPVVRIITQLSEPMLYPVRRRVPYMGGVDLSPMLVILVLVFLDNFLVPSLQRLAFGLLH